MVLGGWNYVNIFVCITSYHTGGCIFHIEKKKGNWKGGGRKEERKGKRVKEKENEKEKTSCAGIKPLFFAFAA